MNNSVETVVKEVSPSTDTESCSSNKNSSMFDGYETYFDDFARNFVHAELQKKNS